MQKKEVSMDAIRYNADGLVPVVTQEWETGQVLMLAYMNEEAVRKTLETKQATYFSRSRQELWIKGATSGHTQQVHRLSYDCDADALLMMVTQKGPACHTGEHSCFFNELVSADQLSPSPQAIVDEYNVILSRKENPKEDSYTNYLFESGVDKICKKVGEEATEVVLAVKNDSKEELTYEAADLIYHLLVAIAEVGVTPEEIFKEMRSRA